MSVFKVKFMDERGNIHDRYVRAVNESDAIFKVGTFVRVLACDWVGRS